jgi:hypothetical protein
MYPPAGVSWGLLFLLQAVRPMATNNTTIETMASQLRRRRGVMKNSINANAVPPVEGQNRFGFSFAALPGPVVFTVSVDVWAAAPVMVTEVGLRVQVGMSVIPIPPAEVVT